MKTTREDGHIFTFRNGGMVGERKGILIGHPKMHGMDLSDLHSSKDQLWTHANKNEATGRALF